MKNIFLSAILLFIVGSFISLFFSTHSMAPVYQMAAQGKEINIERKEVNADFLKKDLRITAIGDSLTEGLGDTTNSGGYIGLLEKQYSNNRFVKTLQVHNLGIPGLRSDQLLKKMKSESFEEKIRNANIIFITIGGNDLVKIVQKNFLSLSVDIFEKEKEKYANNLTQILQMIGEKNPNAKVYYIGLFNPFIQTLSELDEINQIIDSWNIRARVIKTDFENVTYVPIDDIFKTSEENLLFLDQFHPNQSGYKLIAERVLTYVEESEKVNANVQSEGQKMY